MAPAKSGGSADFLLPLFRHDWAACDPCNGWNLHPRRLRRAREARKIHHRPSYTGRDRRAVLAFRGRRLVFFFHTLVSGGPSLMVTSNAITTRSAGPVWI